ncbi:MAG: replication-relaxation family protein [Coriobacteriia bacterium]|nr:replication-relaxation family protein [Coriobacteriia bacterium]
MSRTPRNKRVLGYPRMILQERDRAIVIGVYENRFLKREQIERLFFATTSACNQRLAKLYQHRLLDRLYLPVDIGSSQAVYAIDRLGAELVAGHHEVPVARINWRRKHNRVEYFFLEHTVGVAEVNVAMQLALRERDDVRLLTWKREAFIHREKVADPEEWDRKLSLIPDAFFGLEGLAGRSPKPYALTILPRISPQGVAFRYA